MTLDHTASTHRLTHIGLGDFAVGGRNDSMSANLGSCVGICLAWPAANKFSLAHVVLPKPRSEEASRRSPARFASTVVAFLLEQLRIVEDQFCELVAYVAGGSQLYGNSSSVGAKNHVMLLQSLAEHGIRVAESDLGGDLPRQMVVHGQERVVRSIQLDGAVESEQVWEFPAA